MDFTREIHVHLALIRVGFLHDVAKVPGLEGVAHARAVVDGGVVPRQAFFRWCQLLQGVRKHALQRTRNLDHIVKSS